VYRITQKLAVSLAKFASKDTTRITHYVGFLGGGGELPRLVATDGHRGAVLFLDGYKAEREREDAILAAPDKTQAEVLQLRKLHKQHEEQRKNWAFPRHERFFHALRAQQPVVGWTRDAWEGLAKAAGSRGELLVSEKQLVAKNAKGATVGTVSSEARASFPAFGLAAHSLCPWWGEKSEETPCGVNPAYLADLADLACAVGKPPRLYPSPSALAAHDDVGLIAVIMGLRDN
jgi:hypothetical protein